MSDSYFDEANAVTSKVFNSSLEWNIVNFKEYSKRDIGSITSRKIPIEGTNAWWVLHVHPHGYHSSSKYDYEDTHSSSSYDDDSFVSLSLQIKCEKPARNHFFKIEVKTDLPHDRDETITAPLNPLVWRVEVENVDKKTHLELYKEAFIKDHVLSSFMFDGTLRLLAKVSMKTLDVWDHARLDGQHKFINELVH